MLFIQAFTSLGVYLVALALAAILMLLCRIHKDVSCLGCQVIAYFILILALLGIIGTGIYKITLLQNGVLTPKPCPMMMHMMQNKMMDETKK